MPSISSKLSLTGAAISAGTALADINLIKGSFYNVEDSTALSAIPISRIDNGQIVWVEGESKTYIATVTLADYVSTFVDTVSWAVFNGFTDGTFVSASFDDGTNEITFFSNSTSMSVDLSSLSGGGGGAGDITSVIAGGGLTDGASSGTATLEVGEGDGITVGIGLVSLNTGSVHFTEGVQKTNLDGGDI